MFDFVTALSGFKVEELPNGKISLTGLNFRVLIKEIIRVHGSKAINGMLTKNSSYRIELWAFYVPDLIFLIKSTLEDIKKRHYTSNSRNLRKILEGLITTKIGAGVFDIYENQGKYPHVVADYSMINLKPFPQQLDFIDECTHRQKTLGLKGYLLYSKPGSGKTLTSLYLMESQNMDKVIVICPKKSINTVWEKTLVNNYTKNNAYTLSVNKTHTGDTDVLDVSKRFIVVHYESLQHGFDAIVQSLGEFRGRVGIILDECHNFNDRDSDRSILFRQLVKTLRPEFCLWMSGTPLKAMGKETFTMMATIDPLFNSYVEQSFFDVFGKNNKACARIIGHRIGLISTEMAKKEIEKELNTHTVKVTLNDGHYYTLKAVRLRMLAYVEQRTDYYNRYMDDFVKDYYRCIDYYRSKVSNNADKLAACNEYVKGAEAIRLSYDPVRDKDKVKQLNIFENKVILPELPNDMKHTFRKAKSVFKYVQLTIVGEALGNILGKDRTACNLAISKQLSIGALVEYSNGTKKESTIEEIITSAEGKSLLFTDFVEVVNSMVKQLNDNGVSAEGLTGENSKDLNKLVNQFHKDEDLATLVTTFKTLGEAVPITVANTVVMLNAPFRDGIYEQAFRRAYRIGQELDVDVYNVLLDTGDEINISTRNKEIMDWSKEMVDIMLGKKGVDMGDLDGITSDVFVPKNNAEPFLIKKNGFLQSIMSLFD